MTHDPLCHLTKFDSWTSCSVCDLIAKVRNDTLDAALKALYAMENMGGYPEFAFDHIRDDFRDVIDSLKEKP